MPLLFAYMYDQNWFSHDVAHFILFFSSEIMTVVTFNTYKFVGEAVPLQSLWGTGKAFQLAR